jgi:hypothetical protein
MNIYKHVGTTSRAAIGTRNGLLVSDLCNKMRVHADAAPKAPISQNAF